MSTDELHTIGERVKRFREALPEGVQLLAISKFHPAEAIAEAYAVGQRAFGENYVQEMVAKAEALPKDIEWHFTGHMQTNKVKYIAPFVTLIHAVDSFRLLKEIDKQAAKCQRVIGCLLQLHVAHEDTKFGLTMDECTQLLEKEPWRELQHVHIAGLMAMGTNTDDREEVRHEFHQVKAYFDTIKSTYFAEDDAFSILSEGMSGDYDIAIEEGSTMVRIGTMLFGPRK